MGGNNTRLTVKIITLYHSMNKRDEISLNFSNAFQIIH